MGGWQRVKAKNLEVKSGKVTLISLYIKIYIVSIEK